MRILRESIMETGESLLHGCAHPSEEVIGTFRLLERRIICCPLHVKIGGQIVIGIAKPIRSRHPYGFTAQTFAQGLERTALVVHPVHPYLATRVLLQDEFPPMRRNAPCNGDRAINGKVLFTTVTVGLDEGQGFDDGTRRRRLGSEIECIKPWWEHTPVMPPVRRS